MHFYSRLAMLQLMFSVPGFVGGVVCDAGGVGVDAVSIFPFVRIRCGEGGVNVMRFLMLGCPSSDCSFYKIEIWCITLLNLPLRQRPCAMKL